MYTTVSTPSGSPISAPASQPQTTEATSTPSSQSPPSSTTAKAQTPPATAAEVRKLKLKLEGQDIELPESEVIALAQQGRVAAKRFQEASLLKKQAEDILKSVEENPADFFNKRGKNAREWAEKYLLEQIRRDQMSPEQRQASENERKLKEYESREKQVKEEARQKELSKLQKKHMENYDKLFVEALTQSGLPKTPYTVKRMAELQLLNVKKGYNLDSGSLAKIVREDYISEQKQLFGQMDGDALMEALGPDVVKKLSKAQIAKLKARGSNGQYSKPIQKSEPEGNTEAGISWKELKRRNRFRTS